MLRAAFAVFVAALVPFEVQCFAPARPIERLVPWRPQSAWSTARPMRLCMSAVPAEDLSSRGRALSEKLSGVSVYLVGMMGSGKSTVGNLFAKSLGSYTYLDTDMVIENLMGKTCAELFAEEGEEQFRAVETAVLTQVQAYVRMIVGTGGGIVKKDENWGRLQSGLVVYLDVPVSVIAQRLAAQAKAEQSASASMGASAPANAVSSRPLLAAAVDAATGAVDEAALSSSLAALLADREAKYNQADVVVKFSGSEALDECVVKVIEAMDSFINNNPPKWKQWKEKVKLPSK